MKRGFTLVEAMIVLAIIGIVLVIVVSNCGRMHLTEMERCAEDCGPLARPALLPSGPYGFRSCACFPKEGAPYPYPERP